MVEYYLGQREQTAICEEDTWATLGVKTMAANGFIPGKNVRIEPDFTNNWTEVLQAGAGTRDISSLQKGQYSLGFSLTFVVTDWRFMRYCAHGTVSNTNSGGYYTHTFTGTDSVKSFTTEWARRGTSNNVLTLTGCIITGINLNFQKSASTGEGFIVATCKCLAKIYATGTSITSVSANSLTPFHYRMSKLTLNTTEIVEVNSGEFTIDNGINEDDARYANATLDQYIGEPIPTVRRYTMRANVNLKDNSFLSLWTAQTTVPGTNTLEFIRGTNDNVTFTFTSLYLNYPKDPTNVQGVNVADITGTIVSTAIVAKDLLNTY